MKVLYDYQAFMQNYGGVSNSFVQLIKHLPDSIDYKIVINESDNVHLKNSKLVDVSPMRNSPRQFLSNRSFRGKRRVYDIYSKFFPRQTSYGRNRLCAIAALKEGNFDIFHPTSYDDYFLPYLNGKPFVLTIHDMIPELFFKKSEPNRKKKPLLVKRAAHIIAVSEKTKEDLIQILDVPDNKVTIVYHGAPDDACSWAESPIVEGDYIFYVGQRGLYKYWAQMMEQLAPVFERHKNLRIVCTGEPLNNSETLQINRLGLNGRVVQLHPSDIEMPNLYHYAKCFIFPSVYEGFGIPILEAYSAHCPVILNHKSCFPEIAQDGAVFFNLDEDSSDLAEVMEQFLAMRQEDKNSLIEKQLQRLKYFSWEKSAQKLADVYLSLM